MARAFCKAPHQRPAPTSLILVSLGLACSGAGAWAQEYHQEHSVRFENGEEVVILCDGEFSTEKAASHGLLSCSEISLGLSQDTKVSLHDLRGKKVMECKDRPHFFPDGKVSCDSRLYRRSQDGGWMDALARPCEDLENLGPELYFCHGEIIDTSEPEHPISLAQDCKGPPRIVKDSVLCISGPGVLGTGLFRSTRKIPIGGPRRQELRAVALVLANPNPFPPNPVPPGSNDVRIPGNAGDHQGSRAEAGPQEEVGGSGSGAGSDTSGVR